MPGVDFRAIRAAVSIDQVLELVDFQNRERAGKTESEQAINYEVAARCLGRHLQRVGLSRRI